MKYEDLTTEENEEHKVFAFKGQCVGNCLRCNEPTTGDFDTDEGYLIKMKCVNCGFKQDFRLDAEADLTLNLPLIYSG